MVFYELVIYFAQAEFCDAISSLGVKDATRKAVEALFDDFDVDKSGTLAYVEMNKVPSLFGSLLHGTLAFVELIKVPSLFGSLLHGTLAYVEMIKVIYPLTWHLACRVACRVLKWQAHSMQGAGCHLVDRLQH